MLTTAICRSHNLFGMVDFQNQAYAYTHTHTDTYNIYQFAGNGMDTTGAYILHIRVPCVVSSTHSSLSFTRLMDDHVNVIDHKCSALRLSPI